MNLDKIYKSLENEPGFRRKQVKKAVFGDLVSNWSEVTTFSKNLREKLELEAPLNIEGEIYKSKKHSTAKAIIKLSDGEYVETVLMRHKDGRNTVCVSSQLGCALGCKFCATGESGFKRNLSTNEIIAQIIFFARYLKDKKGKLTNVVFMGMGEPFLNYDNVMQAIRILNDEEKFNMGARRISISTIGVTEGIRKLARENLEINLAISLHAPNDKLRSVIIPANKKYNIKRIMEAVDYYIEKTGRKVMFEYLMIKDVNDSEKEARELAEFMVNKLYMINLIPYNPTGKFKPSEKGRIRKFKDILERSGVNVTQRFSFGQDIDAACGQLAGKKNKN